MRFTRFLNAIAPLALATVLAGCAATESATTAHDAASPGQGFARETTPLTTDDATLIVRGLSCPKCANNVNLALGRLPGIEETHIDMGKGEVHVVFDQLAKTRPSKAQLAQAITDAGFTIVDIRAD